jgi:flavin-dependent dehydrogenase
MRLGPIRIVGAGVAGLSTAIALARRGIRSEVFERRPASAARRPLRWDAIENWTTAVDLRVLLARSEIDNSPFHAPPTVEVRAFDGEPHQLHSDRPLLYVVRRGDAPGGLEATLVQQALDLGVSIHRGTTLAPEAADVWATGTARRGFFLDVGLTFRTDLSDQLVILVNQKLTPKACGYLIVGDGTATLAVLLTRAFKDARRLLADTVATFQRLRPFAMHDARLRGGFGGAPAAFGFRGTGPLHVGEAAGFLDYLWGFGIRHALSSGVLAADAICEEDDYAQLVARELSPLVQASLINRRLYDWAGNRTCRALVRYFCTQRDPHALLQRSYRSRRLRALCWPWVQPLLARPA